MLNRLDRTQRSVLGGYVQEIRRTPPFMLDVVQERLVEWINAQLSAAYDDGHDTGKQDGEVVGLDELE